MGSKGESVFMYSAIILVTVNFSGKKPVCMFLQLTRHLLRKAG